MEEAISLAFILIALVIGGFYVAIRAERQREEYKYENEYYFNHK